MCPVIRIPDHIYSRLEKHAVGFDTPASVIERMLDVIESSLGDQFAQEVKESSTPVQSSGKRDSTKYLFHSKKFGKSRLVLAVVKDYAECHEGISMDVLEQQFPKELQGSIGVISLEADAREILSRSGHKRHFLDSEELIELSDCTVAVCTQWGVGNIDKFLQQAKSLGYEITEV